MKLSLAYLGPTGTNSETAALTYSAWLSKNQQFTTTLCPYPSIALALQSVARGEVDLAVVPIENSIEGSVTIVLDTLWQSSSLQVHQELTLPIYHGLLSFSQSLEQLETIYSHPQALAQCQQWLENFLPQVQLIPTRSTTEGIKLLKEDLTAAAIASPRASELYQVPLLESDIKDSPDNCTRFWIISSQVSDKLNGILNDSASRAASAKAYRSVTDREFFRADPLGHMASLRGSHLSLAFSLSKNAPGALVKTLQIFARREINLSKIESRPTKRSLGEYIFFMDVEGNSHNPEIVEALAELSKCTEILKIFGNYNQLDVEIASFN